MGPRLNDWGDIQMPFKASVFPDNYNAEKRCPNSHGKGFFLFFYGRDAGVSSRKTIRVPRPCGGSDAAESVCLDQFGFERMKQCFAESKSGTEVAALFEAMIQHAGSSSLSDDATAVVVAW
jgi:hypothetical protein